ncbi:MAG: ASCH domain-containing protein, partial [Proteobacteria bacterium]|nr:ASCH domain-containing protein [Pseudomonadota bacterium]
QIGDHWVVKDWEGHAVCITKTSKVTIIPFNEISENHAHREGEGDKSLRYWQEAHKSFYRREFEGLGLIFSETMPIVFEEFDTVYP